MMLRKLQIAAAVLALAAMVLSCKASINWLDFAASGGDIHWIDVAISVSDKTPQPGQEIRVRASSKYASTAERETSFLFIPGPPSSFTYTATAGQFRRAVGELNDAGAIYEGSQISAGTEVYWRAPAKPGKVILTATAGDGKGTIKVMVTED
jgi:hypothetical protein